MNIHDTLSQRADRYGDYKSIASTSQDLKSIIKEGDRYDVLEPEMMESLDMICNKISRIVNGDCFYRDSWHDIVGYAKLIDDMLEEL